MNKKQAYHAGKRAFLNNPEFENFLIKSNIEASNAGLDQGRDEITFPAFVEGYLDAHYDALRESLREGDMKKQTKRGRPRTKVKKTNITIPVEPEMKLKLASEAERLGLSACELARRAIEIGLAKCEQ